MTGLARKATWVLLGVLACARGWAGEAHHTFWAVKGQFNTVYLFGSVHVLKAGDRELPGEAERAYAAAKSLVMELDLSKAEAGGLSADALQDELLPEGQTLESVLGPRAYATLREHAGKLGLDPGLFSQMQPWVVAVTMEQAQMAQLGFDAQSGVEAQLTARAQRDGKPIVALETMDEQIGLFAHLPLDRQRDFLMYSLEEADNDAQQMDEVVAAWRRGDTARLESLLGEGFSRFPDLYRSLTVDRNRRWLPRIEQLLHERQDCLVVVGALHLVGRGGLVELLGRDGYVAQQQ